MTTSVESLTAGADVADAARIMMDERIRCLPIVDGYRVVGVITRRDVLRAAVTRDDHAIKRDVLQVLTTFNDPDRWAVIVQAAVVGVEDSLDCADDRELARQLIAKVPGVASVSVRHETIGPA